MSWGVSLAAMVPVMRAVARASPFASVEVRRRGRVVRGEERVRVAMATAVRWVRGLGVVEIMCAVE